MKNLNSGNQSLVAVVLLVIGGILFFTNVSFGPTTNNSSTILVSLSVSLLFAGVVCLISAGIGGIFKK